MFSFQGAKNGSWLLNVVGEMEVGGEKESAAVWIGKEGRIRQPRL